MDDARRSTGANFLPRNRRSLEPSLRNRTDVELVISVHIPTLNCCGNCCNFVRREKEKENHGKPRFQSMKLLKVLQVLFYSEIFLHHEWINVTSCNSV